MAEFETTAGDTNVTNEEQESLKERTGSAFRKSLKRFIAFISFGPGVLGFIWLIGRILRR